MMRRKQHLIMSSGVLVMTLVLAGCVSPEQQRAMDLQSDANQCAATGFKPGSEAMARCMRTAAQMRINDEDREARIQQQQDEEWNKRQREEQKATEAWMNSPPGTSPSSPQGSGSTIDTTPQFDKNGEPNFDTQGNYQGCHAVGCLVDDPDSKK
ncbi:hypothetical protein ACQZWC_004600 [Enterobacter bugandensis]